MKAEFQNTKDKGTGHQKGELQMKTSSFINSKTCSVAPNGISSKLGIT